MQRVIPTPQATSRSGQAIVEYLLILACVSIPLVCALQGSLIPPLLDTIHRLAEWLTP